jgi:hypothetical protein
MGKTVTATAANPAAPASTEAALAEAAQDKNKGQDKKKGGTGRQWICSEDCLLADGFHYKDEIVEAAECPPHFAAIPEQAG